MYFSSPISTNRILKRCVPKDKDLIKLVILYWSPRTVLSEGVVPPQHVVVKYRVTTSEFCVTTLVHTKSHHCFCIISAMSTQWKRQTVFSQHFYKSNHGRTTGGGRYIHLPWTFRSSSSDGTLTSTPKLWPICQQEADRQTSVPCPQWQLGFSNRRGDWKEFLGVK